MGPGQALPGAVTLRERSCFRRAAHMKRSDSPFVHPAFEHEVVRKTQCEVHIFDPTLSLGKQQELGRVKEFTFHDVGLTAEGSKVQQRAQ